MNNNPAAGTTKVPWTEERVTLLKKLWEEGLSASQIAAQLGCGVTRNAIIGKVHRLNLSGRVTAERERAARGNQDCGSGRQSKNKAESAGPLSSQKPGLQTSGATALKAYVQPATLTQPNIAPQPIRLVDLSAGGKVTILHLSERTCKWPIGDPGEEDFCFCGHKPLDGTPYCSYHARVAYQPLQDRRYRKTSHG